MIVREPSELDGVVRGTNAVSPHQFEHCGEQLRVRARDDMRYPISPLLRVCDD